VTEEEGALDDDEEITDRGIFIVGRGGGLLLLTVVIVAEGGDKLFALGDVVVPPFPLLPLPPLFPYWEDLYPGWTLWWWRRTWLLLVKIHLHPGNPHGYLLSPLIKGFRAGVPEECVGGAVAEEASMTVDVVNVLCCFFVFPQPQLHQQPVSRPSHN